MRYQVTTTLTPREALEQALADFGPGGLGLQITSQTNLSLGFQGGGGYIAVSAQPGAKDDSGIGDARVGLCRAALHGQGPADGAPGGSAGGVASGQTRPGQHHSLSSMTCRPGQVLCTTP